LKTNAQNYGERRYAEFFKDDCTHTHTHTHTQTHSLVIHITLKSFVYSHTLHLCFSYEYDSEYRLYPYHI